jgi:hypothetical protein
MQQNLWQRLFQLYDPKRKLRPRQQANMAHGFSNINKIARIASVRIIDDDNNVHATQEIPIHTGKMIEPLPCSS